MTQEVTLAPSTSARRCLPRCCWVISLRFPLAGCRQRHSGDVKRLLSANTRLQEQGSFPL